MVKGMERRTCMDGRWRAVMHGLCSSAVGLLLSDSSEKEHAAGIGMKQVQCGV